MLAQPVKRRPLKSGRHSHSQEITVSSPMPLRRGLARRRTLSRTSKSVWPLASEYVLEAVMCMNFSIMSRLTSSLSTRYTRRGAEGAKGSGGALGPARSALAKEASETELKLELELEHAKLEKTLWNLSCLSCAMQGAVSDWNWNWNWNIQS